MTETTALIAAAARITAIATALTAVGTGVMAGVFFTFSTSVMPALAKQPAAAAITAMQQMNISIVNPLFLLVLVGSTLCCLALVVTAPFTGAAHLAARVAGCLIFLVGAIGLTAAVNVPMNNALAVVDPASSAGVSLWRDYLVRWTRFNHVRALASVVATALLIWSARS